MFSALIVVPSLTDLLVFGEPTFSSSRSRVVTDGIVATCDIRRSVSAC